MNTKINKNTGKPYRPEDFGGGCIATIEARDESNSSLEESMIKLCDLAQKETGKLPSYIATSDFTFWKLSMVSLHSNTPTQLFSEEGNVKIKTTFGNVKITIDARCPDNQAWAMSDMCFCCKGVLMLKTKDISETEDDTKGEMMNIDEEEYVTLNDLKHELYRKFLVKLKFNLDTDQYLPIEILEALKFLSGEMK